VKRSRARRITKLDTTLPPPSPLLLALEGRAFLEWGSLMLAWPWLRSAPSGDGHPVLVLPGLAASDNSTWPLRRYLESLGYAAYPWELGSNVGPRDGVVRSLTDRVRSLQKKHKRKLSLVGWSLGGAMARALAVRMPSRIRSVITLGSPIAGHPRATNAWRLFEWVSGISADDPGLMEVIKRQPPVPHTSILSKTDGIVHWRASLAPDFGQSENIEVTASHFGLGANPAVLWAIADRLSQAEGRWRPFERNGWRSVFYKDPLGFRINGVEAG
jgi:pimeloyl-ACP methyl ester carboxylesterase